MGEKVVMEGRNYDDRLRWSLAELLLFKVPSKSTTSVDIASGYANNLSPFMGDPKILATDTIGEEISLLAILLIYQ